MTKTNVMRLLDAAGVAYRTAEYEYDESDLSGRHAAEQLDMPAEQVFKTLVARGDRSGPVVFCWTSSTCGGRPPSPATRKWSSSTSRNCCPSRATCAAAVRP